MIKLAVFGSAGRMGQAVIRASLRFPDIRLAAAVEAAECPALGRDAGVPAGIGEIGIKIDADALSALKAADAAVDFSAPGAAAEHARLAAECRKPMVIGTTGLDDGQSAIVRTAALTIPLVWSANMSLGMNLLFSLVRQAARNLEHYDIEIIETHHRHKKDSPSGSALRLAQAAAEGAGLDLKASAVYGRRGLSGGRPEAQIGIHSVRGGDVVGDHTVIFAEDGERIELTHRARSRECFALGALKAAAWAAAQPAGLYSMRDVLGLKD